MSSHIDNVEHWNSRAEEMLTRMEEANDERVRGILVRIYWDYLRLARLAEERATHVEEAVRAGYKLS